VFSSAGMAQNWRAAIASLSGEAASHDALNGPDCASTTQKQRDNSPANGLQTFRSERYPLRTCPVSTILFLARLMDLLSYRATAIAPLCASCMNELASLCFLHGLTGLLHTLKRHWENGEFGV
jgi:hypothetical protein